MKMVDVIARPAVVCETFQEILQREHENITCSSPFFEEFDPILPWTKPIKACAEHQLVVFKVFEHCLGQLSVALFTCDPRTTLGAEIGSGIVWFLSTSDRGSNEVMNRKLTMCLVEDIDRAIFLDNDCWEHSCQLCVLGSLKLVDQMMLHAMPVAEKRSWKYYSSIATVCNVCRDVARDMFETWKQFFGPESAIQHVRKLFPRCCAGRWLSIAMSEDRIIKSKESLLQSVLTAVLKKKSVMENDEAEQAESGEKAGNAGNADPSSAPASKTKSKNNGGNNVGNVDLLAVEQSKHYSETMGKWRKHALVAVSGPLWHRAIAGLNIVKGPLTHFSCFLKKTVGEQALLRHGNTLHQLVCGRSKGFLQEFEGMLCSFAAFEMICLWA